MDKIWQGATLRKLRMLAGVSLNGVAAACGVSHGSVSQWELGMTTPARRHLEKMAEVYGMPLELLLYEIGYELSNPPSLRQWYKARSDMAAAHADDSRQNMQGAGGETTAPDAVLTVEAARKRGRMPYSAGGSAVYAYSHP